MDLQRHHIQFVSKSFSMILLLPWWLSCIPKSNKLYYLGCKSCSTMFLYDLVLIHQTEYSSIILDAHTVVNISKIEKIQRRAARFVKGNYDWSCSVTKMSYLTVKQKGIRRVFYHIASDIINNYFSIIIIYTLHNHIIYFLCSVRIF